MLLVRPDGLSRYYEIQAAARELGIDFGYEFVDADWVLRFDDDTPPPAVAVDDPAGSPRPHTPGRSPAVPLAGRGGSATAPGPRGDGPASAAGRGSGNGPVLGVRGTGDGGFGSGTSIPGLLGGTGPPGLRDVVGLK